MIEPRLASHHWSDRETLILTIAWGAGETASAIAREIEAQCNVRRTIHAITNKADRLKLPMRNKVAHLSKNDRPNV